MELQRRHLSFHPGSSVRECRGLWVIRQQRQTVHLCSTCVAQRRCLIYERTNPPKSNISLFWSRKSITTVVYLVNYGCDVTNGRLLLRNSSCSGSLQRKLSTFTSTTEFEHYPNFLPACGCAHHDVFCAN